LNRVTLTAKYQNDKITEKLIDLQTEPLPVYISPAEIIKAVPNLYNPGMNFTYLNNKVVFDINGDVRWYSTQSSTLAFSRLANGHYLFTYLVSGEPNNIVMEEDLLGKIYAIYNIANGVNHDFAELPNGNLLMTTDQPGNEYINDSLIEVDRSNGHIIENYDFKNYLDVNRPSEIGITSQDWLHMDSIVYDSSDQSIIVSNRA
jgi:arylsulfate sulfotransferase